MLYEFKNDYEPKNPLTSQDASSNKNDTSSMLHFSLSIFLNTHLSATHLSFAKNSPKSPATRVNNLFQIHRDRNPNMGHTDGHGTQIRTFLEGTYIRTFSEGTHAHYTNISFLAVKIERGYNQR